jgi:HSP20 family protein
LADSTAQDAASGCQIGRSRVQRASDQKPNLLCRNLIAMSAQRLIYLHAVEHENELKMEVVDMTLVKFKPMRANCCTPGTVDQLVNSFFNERWPGYGQEFSGWAPEVDVEETTDAIIIRADLPGMDKSDINISVENRELTIRGERKNEVDEAKSNFHRVERTYGSFRRTFSLPANVQADKVDATYKDGVLEVSVPKAEAVKPKAIEIKS